MGGKKVSTWWKQAFHWVEISLPFGGNNTLNIWMNKTI